MPDYSIFGGCLRSELQFPELRPSQQPPRWTLRLSAASPEARHEEVIGAASEPPCNFALYRTTDGFRLYHSCTGNYDISADGTAVVWRPVQNAKVESARIDVTGRVLSIALHARGALCLHGSGVMLENEAVAFLAPKGYGKSTLAIALLNAGGQLITDDTFAVEPTSPATVLPGVHSMRLRSDSARRLLGRGATTTRALDGKHVVSNLDEDRLMSGPAPLKAIYILSPFAGNWDDASARRTLMPTLPAAISLVRHVKAGVLLGGPEATVVLDRAVAVAREVPVYTLHVVRDLNRLAEVVAQLVEWHAPTPCESSVQ
jgi:hypothetical protein